MRFNLSHQHAYRCYFGALADPTRRAGDDHGAERSGSLRVSALQRGYGDGEREEAGMLKSTHEGSSKSGVSIFFGVDRRLSEAASANH